MPAGGKSRLKIRVLAGMSGSAAVLVTTSVVSSSIDWLAMAVNTGGLFTSSSVTMTMKLPVSLSGGEPLSVTRTVTRLVLGSCASVGAQLRTPLLGSRLTPSGADTRLKVSVLAGRSRSVAVLVTTSAASPWIILYVSTVSTGARFSSLTTTVKLLVALSAGVPLSVTLTVIVFVLGPCASVGVQVSSPVVGSTATPDGPLTRAKASVLAGRSVSVAVFVTTSALSSLIV